MIFVCPNCGTENNLPDTVEQRKKHYQENVYCANCGTMLLNASEVRRRLLEIMHTAPPTRPDRRWSYLCGFLAIMSGGTFGYAYATTGFWFFLVVIGGTVVGFVGFALLYWFNPPSYED